MRALPFVVAFVAFASRASATTYVDDPLTASTFSGRGASGGSFGPTGWTTSGDTDALWYEIADPLPTGKLEVDVTGLSVGGSLSGADHDLLAIYQAPTGVAEPIAYSPYFRNNDFKAFLRIFGSMETGRGGAMKLELALCPRGAPWYHDDVCPSDCDRGGLAYAGGSPTDVGWVATTTYHLAIAWGGGKAVISRDAVDLATLPYPGTYAPGPVRVRVGSPRHGSSALAFMPHGLRFANLKIMGSAGTMTPACGTIAPDAGGDGGTSITTLDALADVTVDMGVTGVYPDVTDLAVEANSEIAYLRFPPVPAGMVVKHATLKLRTSSSPSANGGSGTVHAVLDDTWDETKLTWADKPPIEAKGLGVAHTVDPDQDVEFDVTALAQVGVRSFAIVSDDPNGAHYLSKEAPGGNGPKLLLDLEPGAPDAGSPDSSLPQADAATDDATTDASGALRDAANDGDVASDSSDSSGCGCRMTATRSTNAFVLLLALVIARCRRRGPS